MCGLAGVIGMRQIDDERVECCLRAMHHRGPDASGVFRHAVQDRRLTLCHTRLSIIDLDRRAHQPMRSGSKVIAFNGEIYNYIELRKTLESHGVHLRTNSDTEVLLEILKRYGVAGLDRCEGMWAFALYDELDGSLVLSRDRFGEKPLYLCETPNALYFASEIKFIRLLADRSLEVDEHHLRRYLAFGYKAIYKSSEGFFKNVRELRPGAVLQIDGSGRMRESTYWRPQFDQQEGMTFESAVETARDAVVESVRLRLRADVPLAFLMSGGVDSNALISIAQRRCGFDVHGFTAIDEDGRYDEQELVTQAVRELGIRHTVVRADRSEFLANLRSLVRAHDAPVYTITWYTHAMLVDAIAAEGYRICISGIGADELFTGYYDHHLAYLYEARRDRKLFDRSLSAWSEHVKPLIRNPSLRDPELFMVSRTSRDHVFDGAAEANGMLVDRCESPFVETDYCDDLLRNRMLNELFCECIPPVLHEDDHNSMAASIENRSPFLDRALFECCQRIPTRHLVRNGFAKAVLREAVRGIAPDAIVNQRRKIGWNAPIASYLDCSDPEVREQVLEPGLIDDFVRRDAVVDLLSASTMSNAQSKCLFRVLSAKMFLEEVAQQTAPVAGVIA